MANNWRFLFVFVEESASPSALVENLGITPLAWFVAAARELHGELPSAHTHDPVRQQIMGKFGMAGPRREKCPLVSQKMQQDLSEIARDRCAIHFTLCQKKIFP